MHKRIKELAHLSGIDIEENNTFQEFAEKTRLNCFAELIIQDLLNKLSTEQELADQNWQCKDGVHIYYKLHQHFTTKETTA